MEFAGTHKVFGTIFSNQMKAIAATDGIATLMVKGDVSTLPLRKLRGLYDFTAWYIVPGDLLFPALPGLHFEADFLFRHGHFQSKIVQVP